MNCFHFTYLFLKEQGLKIPDQWNGFSYNTESIKINANPKYYINSKLLINYFDSFTQTVKIAEKNDIILHHKGVGVALNKSQFSTLNHLGNIIIKPIQKYHIIKRVTDG